MKKTSMMRKEHKVSIFPGKNYCLIKENNLPGNLDNNSHFRNQLTHLYEEILAGLSWSA